MKLKKKHIVSAREGHFLRIVLSTRGTYYLITWCSIINFSSIT